MKRRIANVLLGFCIAFPLTATANEVVGTWRMASAVLESGNDRVPAYGPNPNGWLVFTPELTFVEVLTDPRVPNFASPARGEGTNEENRRAMASNIGLFGRYTVDEQGRFSGNRVLGSTFPNWVGAVRTRDDIQFTVEGDRMIEQFTRPEGTMIEIVWERVE